MRVFAFRVSVASDSLDQEVVESVIAEALGENLPNETLVMVGRDGVKEYSEQGWKNARCRVFGKSVKDVGDGHKAKKIKEDVSEEAVTP